METMPELTATAAGVQLSPKDHIEKSQPWRQIPGMPSKGEDEKFENGTKGIVVGEDEVRLDCLADVGTNLGG